ncbi:MAG: sulfatase-like hydrolase/transferase, partial [Anaerolineae bacterium]|nr:sulfatase-like hydrolase/transferase [Anaerolineae bacterium]NIN97513.1 sulfatase-like hydrolase/transferase [Anaerolineae bacterium]NIQ80442.1 sulfatase-like hydrolase/transferase [Anaerolineae bacterium]
YFDPHAPYDPPPPYDYAFRESPYDGEISFTDLQIGLLLDGLKKYRLDRNTLVVLTADHGEG